MDALTGLGSGIDFARPACLWLLPLALLPLWRWQRQTQTYPGMGLLPADPLSRQLDWLIRLLALCLLVALVVAIAEPYRGGQTINKIGTGAHVVVLLDRSSSMNDAFAQDRRGTTNGMIDRTAAAFQGTKNEVARAVLNQLVDEGTNDFYGLVSFSTSALYMLPLSQNLDVIRAGINSTLNRGRGATAVHKGLELALGYFTDQPRTGARIILLVSDGGGMIPADEESRLRQQFREEQVSIYWIYLKSAQGNTLVKPATEVVRSANPEHFLNDFFTSLDVPYHAYEIEQPGALAAAVADIKALKNQPLQYQQTLPRSDLAVYAYALALLLLLLLLPVRWLEADAW